MQVTDEPLPGLLEQETETPVEPEHAWAQPRRRLPRLRTPDRWSAFG